MLRIAVFGALAAWVCSLSLTGAARWWSILATVAAGDLAVAMVAIGVRQWRMAPRVRVANAALLAAAAVTITLAVPTAAAVHHWSAGLALVTSLAGAVAISGPTAARADAALREHGGTGPRRRADAGAGRP